MHRYAQIFSLILIVFLTPSIQASAGLTPLDTDLLTNGGGEAGASELGQDDGIAYFDLPGWEAERGQWVAQDGAWYDIGAPDGKRYLRPLPGEIAKLSQTVQLDLPADKPRYVVLRAMARNWAADNDQPSIELQLLDGQEKVISTQTVGPIKNASWSDYAIVAQATKETRSARVKLICKRLAGTHNDGYFDQVRLTLSDHRPLLANFTAERIPGTLPPQYRFVDQTPGEINKRQWVFSDGEKREGNSVTRTFKEAGQYGVKLTAWNKDGVSGSAERSNAVTVTEDDLSVQIIKGPYLQMPTKDGVTIMWETNIAADTTVIIGACADIREVRSDKKQRIHEVRVEGFEPDEQVDYVVRSRVGQYEVESEMSSFTTAPSADTPWRLAVWGDSQDRPHVFSELVKAMGKARPNLLLGVGDLVSDGRVYAQWENRLFTPIKPLAMQVPFIAAKGNHEYDAQWWYKFMSLPMEERWFAYSYANARFIVLDTNYPFQPGSDQYKWLVEELDSEDSKSATWLMAAQHHPPFSEIYEEDRSKQLREHIWPLYEKAGVDINFHGHIHDYERGIYTPKSTGRRIATVQTSGGGGSLWKDEFDGDWPQIDKVIQWKHHWCQLDFKDDNLDFKAIDIDGNIIDEWSLKALPR